LKKINSRQTRAEWFAMKATSKKESRRVDSMKVAAVRISLAIWHIDLPRYNGARTAKLIRRDVARLVHNRRNDGDRRNDLQLL